MVAWVVRSAFALGALAAIGWNGAQAQSREGCALIVAREANGQTELISFDRCAGQVSTFRLREDLSPASRLGVWVEIDRRAPLSDAGANRSLARIADLADFERLMLWLERETGTDRATALSRPLPPRVPSRDALRQMFPLP
jgi:hypothetical protein